MQYDAVGVDNLLSSFHWAPFADVIQQYNKQRAQCWTLMQAYTFTSNVLVLPKQVLTRVLCVLYRAITIIRFSGLWYCHSIGGIIPLFILLFAFSRSRKPQQLSCSNSNFFSIICFMNNAPVVPFPFLKPNCSSPSNGSTISLILLSQWRIQGGFQGFYGNPLPEVDHV